ncbi:MAG: dihydrofolate reductase [Oligoflexus sp.]
MMLSQIVACSRNGMIGKQGKMPWHISADLRYFKQTTAGHPVIMGRKTFESIGRPLPQRLNIVISRQKDIHFEGAIVASDLNEALEYCRNLQDEWGEEVFVIGGGEIYRLALPLTRRIYLTRIDANVEGDTSFPDIADCGFQKLSSTEPASEGPWRFQFEVWERQ